MMFSVMMQESHVLHDVGVLESNSSWSVLHDQAGWHARRLGSDVQTQRTSAKRQSTHCHRDNKKAQLSLTNPRDAKACQKLLQFDVHTTLSLTILAYLHSFSCCSVRNPKSREIHWKFKLIESMVIQGHWSSCQWKAHMWLPMSHYCNFLPYLLQFSRYSGLDRQESPAIADKPTRRESMPKIAPIRRAYNVVADNTGLSSFV